MKVFQLDGTYHKFSAKLGEMPSPRDCYQPKLKTAKRGFLTLKISIDYPNLQSKQTFFVQSALILYGRLPLVVAFYYDKNYYLRRATSLPHATIFELIPCFVQGENVLLFNSLSLSNGKTTFRTVSNLPSGKAFPFGESGAKRRERSPPA